MIHRTSSRSKIVTFRGDRTRVVTPGVIATKLCCIPLLLSIVITAQRVTAVKEQSFTDIPYQNWTDSLIDPQRPNPLFHVRTNENAHAASKQQRLGGGGYDDNFDDDCYRIHIPHHEIMLRIHDDNDDKNAVSDSNTSVHDENRNGHISEEGSRFEQLLVVDLPSFVVKDNDINIRRNNRFNVDVDYETGLVTLDGYGYVQSSPSPRGSTKSHRGSRRGSDRCDQLQQKSNGHGLRGCDNTNSAMYPTSSSSSSLLSSKPQRKYCIHQEFIVDRSMLLQPPSSTSSSSSSSSSSMLTSIWDMTMELNWNERKLTLSLPVSESNIQSTESAAPMETTIMTETIDTSHVPSREERIDDDQTFRELQSKVDFPTTTSTSSSPSFLPEDTKSSLRSGRVGIGARVVATKLCGLARMLRRSNSNDNDIDSNDGSTPTSPCSFSKITKAMTSTSKRTPTKSSTSRIATKMTTMNPPENNPIIDKNNSSVSPTTSTAGAIFQHHRDGYNDDDDHHDRNTPSSSSSFTSHDALERFFAFSLGKNDEESYWLRRM